MEGAKPLMIQLTKQGDSGTLYQTIYKESLERG